ncbi:hypothetical protein FB451DRAFT_1447948 [Mycena latifolia]|nr:hypothetical protein FB451DRAFT_1447948 [Mycena latifolia]
MSSQGKESRCNMLVKNIEEPWESRRFEPRRRVFANFSLFPARNSGAKLAEEVFAEDRGSLTSVAPARKKAMGEGAPAPRPCRRHMVYTNPFSRSERGWKTSGKRISQHSQAGGTYRSAQQAGGARRDPEETRPNARQRGRHAGTQAGTARGYPKTSRLDRMRQGRSIRMRIGDSRSTREVSATVSATSNNSAGGRSERRRGDGEVSSNEGDGGAGVRSEGEAVCGERKQCEAKAAYGMEMRDSVRAWSSVETAYEMGTEIASVRDVRASSAEPRRTPATLIAAPPIPTPRKRGAPTALLGVVDGGAEELAGAVAVVDLALELDAAEEEADAEVDDGTNDGKEGEARDKGHGVGFAVRAEEGWRGATRVKGIEREETHSGATPKQLTATSEAQIAAAAASPRQFATTPMYPS